MSSLAEKFTFLYTPEKTIPVQKYMYILTGFMVLFNVLCAFDVIDVRRDAFSFIARRPDQYLHIFIIVIAGVVAILKLITAFIEHPILKYGLTAILAIIGALAILMFVFPIRHWGDAAERLATGSFFYVFVLPMLLSLWFAGYLEYYYYRRRTPQSDSILDDNFNL